MTDHRLCPECHDPVQAKPGYETRTIYCSRACEDRAWRRRKSVTLRDATTILADLIDQDDCLFDHHGYCQAHGWLSEGECPHARGKRLLAEITSSYVPTDHVRRARRRSVGVVTPRMIATDTALDMPGPDTTEDGR